MKNLKVNFKQIVASLGIGFTLLNFAGCNLNTAEVVNEEAIYELDSDGNYTYNGEDLNELAAYFNLDMETFANVNGYKLADDMKYISNGTKLKVNNEVKKGYKNLSKSSIELKNVDENSFVIYDVINLYNESAITLKDNIKACNKFDIPVGLNISVNPTREVDIYNIIEYVKNIMFYTKLSLPVYLNADEIINNEELSESAKLKLLKIFLDKCGANNICASLSGSNLNKLEGLIYFTNGYGINDSENNNKYAIEDNGELILHNNLPGYIKSNKLNDYSNFVNNRKIVVSEGFDINDMGIEMPLSELLEFNGISEIKEGMILEVPELSKIENNDNKLINPLRGVITSPLENQSYDFKQIGEEYRYALIYASSGIDVDPKLNENIVSAMENNLDVDAYLVNAFNINDIDNNLSEEEQLNQFESLQIQQINNFISSLNNYGNNLNYYLMFNSNDINNFNDKLARIMLNTWIKACEINNHKPGLIVDEEGFKYLQECFGGKLNELFNIHLNGKCDDLVFDSYNEECISCEDLTIAYSNTSKNTKDNNKDNIEIRYIENKPKMYGILAYSSVSLLILLLTNYKSYLRGKRRADYLYEKYGEKQTIVMDRGYRKRR